VDWSILSFALSVSPMHVSHWRWPRHRRFWRRQWAYVEVHVHSIIADTSMTSTGQVQVLLSLPVVILPSGYSNMSVVCRWEEGMHFCFGIVSCSLVDQVCNHMPSIALLMPVWTRNVTGQTKGTYLYYNGSMECLGPELFILAVLMFTAFNIMLFLLFCHHSHHRHWH
jgi:hypothetical protein